MNPGYLEAPAVILALSMPARKDCKKLFWNLKGAKDKSTICTLHNNLGNIHELEKRYPEAIQELGRRLRLTPNMYQPDEHCQYLL